MDYVETDRGWGTPCWIWQRYLNPQNGYGYIGRRAAHRIYFERYRFKIWPGHQLDHLCRQRDCVNPYHLEPVTGAENSRRGDTGAHRRKLSPQQRYEVATSTENRNLVAAQYGITPQYVNEVRSGRRRSRW